MNRLTTKNNHWLAIYNGKEVQVIRVPNDTPCSFQCKKDAAEWFMACKEFEIMALAQKTRNITELRDKAKKLVESL